MTIFYAFFRNHPKTNHTSAQLHKQSESEKVQKSTHAHKDEFLQTLSKHISHKETTKTKIGNQIQRIKTKTIEEDEEVQELIPKKNTSGHKREEEDEQKKVHKKEVENHKNPKKNSEPNKILANPKKTAKTLNLGEITHKANETKPKKELNSLIKLAASAKESIEETPHKKATPKNKNLLNSNSKTPTKSHATKVRKPKIKVEEE